MKEGHIIHILYDGSFNGWLSAVFEVYQRKFTPGSVRLLKPGEMPGDIFSEQITVQPNAEMAARVWKGISAKMSANGRNKIWHCWLSELPRADDMLLRAASHVFSSAGDVENDLGNADMLRLTTLARTVWREKHRMEAFVRFRQLADGLYMAVVEPDFNVLPLIADHFTDRYADQDWLIYDAKRKYGLHHTALSRQVFPVSLPEGESMELGAPIGEWHKDEAAFEKLWQQYFKSTGIKARTNLRLHLKHVPHRYWKYLPEKRPF